jgi:hypothetical protein
MLRHFAKEKKTGINPEINPVFRLYRLIGMPVHGIP